MWISNLEKSRRVLAFDTEKLCVSERFSLIRRRKNNSVQLCPQLARTQARLTTYCAGLCFKSLASNFFYGEQVPSLMSRDSSFVIVTKKNVRLFRLSPANM